MTSNEQTYLSLLRSAIWNESAECLVDSVNWAEIMRLCSIHGTGPLVFDQALKLPQDVGPEPGLAMQMKQQCLVSMVSQQRWEVYVAKTWHTFDDTDVRPVLLKGFGLAALYPQPHLRQWGDLDVWVGVEHYHEACGMLRKTFPGILHPLEEYENYKHYNFEFPDGCSIELHRVTMEFATSRDWQYWQVLEKRGMQGGPSLMVGKTQVFLPTDDFNLLFTFVHALEHFCGTGIPMKQLCDLALLAHSVYGTADARQRKEIDDYLDKHLRALCMLEPWLLIGYVVVKALGLPAEEWPLLKGKIASKHIVVSGEELFARILTNGQQQPAKPTTKKTFSSVLSRKLYTLLSMLESHRSLKASFPRYARHLLWGHIKKGIRRTIRREAPYSHAKSTDL